MSEDEKILVYLKSKYPDWTSPTSIGVIVGGLTRFGQPNHSAWACPRLKRLMKQGLVEKNERRHYRIRKP